MRKVHEFRGIPTLPEILADAHRPEAVHPSRPSGSARFQQGHIVHVVRDRSEQRRIFDALAECGKNLLVVRRRAEPDRMRAAGQRWRFQLKQRLRIFRGDAEVDHIQVSERQSGDGVSQPAQIADAGVERGVATQCVEPVKPVEFGKLGMAARMLKSHGNNLPTTSFETLHMLAHHPLYILQISLSPAPFEPYVLEEHGYFCLHGFGWISVVSLEDATKETDSKKSPFTTYHGVSKTEALSIIIAPSGSAEQLGRTLTSLGHSDGVAEALICCDSCSEAVPPAEKIPGLTVRRVETSSHRSRAINEALRHCTGSIVGILDRGDTYLTDTIPNLLQAFERAGGGGCFYGHTVLAGPDGPPGLFYTDCNWEERRTGHCRFSPPGVFYDRRAITEAGGLDVSLRFWAEYDLWLRLDFGGARFRHLPGIMARRETSRSKSAQSDFSVFPSRESVDEILRVRIAAEGGNLSRAHIAWYGEVCASMPTGRRKNFYSRFASALNHAGEARGNDATRTTQSFGEQVRMLADIYCRTRRRSALQEFGLNRRRPTSVMHRFLKNRLFELEQHPPRPLRLPRRYERCPLPARLPSISIVTPSLNQGEYLESTIRSVSDQSYPALEYVVQDGGSSDGTLEILKAYSSSLASWESAPDGGQASAINRGFERTTGEIMAYLNSDDVLLPGSLAYIARFFESNPEVDVVYGHRILIDGGGKEIGRWILPGHDNEAIAYADFVPQETLFWRRSAWESVGEKLDESFKFAMDYDLILRFRDAGLTFRRLPRFLGAFRVWQDQKTQSLWLNEGLSETRRLMVRTLGKVVANPETGTPLQSYLRKQWWLDKLYVLGLAPF